MQMQNRSARKYEANKSTAFNIFIEFYVIYSSYFWVEFFVFDSHFNDWNPIQKTFSISNRFICIEMRSSKVFFFFDIV